MPKDRVSAKEKLAAFERSQSGQRAFFVRLAIMGGLLVLAFIALFLIDAFQESTGWRKIPRDAARLFRDGKWEDLTELMASDIGFEGMDADRAEAITTLRRLSGAGEFHVSDPFDFSARDGVYRIDFLATFARGDLRKEETIPLVTTWLVRLQLRGEGDGWVVTKATIKPAVEGTLPK